MSDDLDEGGRLEDEEEAEDVKVFMFAGFTGPIKAKEKEELIEKIRLVGGEVDMSPSWNDACTHVVANNFRMFNGKVLAALAGGKWVVTRRYVDRSHKNGAWSNTKPFVCDQAVLVHRRNRLRQGGCFKHMKVLFLLEKEMQKAAYTDVIKAGGGTVLEDWDIDLLLKYKPGPSELTHIVLDPYILSQRDARNMRFKNWKAYADQVWDKRKGETLHYIYYKYFFDYLSCPERKTSVEDYSIFSSRALWLAEQNGDLKMPERRDEGQTAAAASSGETARIPERIMTPPSPTSRAGTEKSLKRPPDHQASQKKRQCTNFNTILLNTNVVDLDDSDDDDIQVLEQRLIAEGGRRRVYFNTTTPNGVRSSSKPSDAEIEKSDRSVDNKEDDDVDAGDEPDFEEIDVSEDDEDDDDGIEIIETVERVSWPTTAATKRSSNFKKKLLEMEAREEKKRLKEERKKLKEQKRLEKLERRAGRTSLDSREGSSPEPTENQAPVVVEAEEIPLPVHAMQKLSLQDPTAQQSVMINRVLSTILERQLANDECIEVSHVALRTARYDKGKESLAEKKKLTVVREQVKEEFYNRYIEKKDLEDKHAHYGTEDEDDEEDNNVNLTIKDEANNHVALLEILEYLKCFTSLTTRPTSSILNVIMKDFIMNQTSPYVAIKSYEYISQFIFLQLGNDKLKRREWLNLMLSALRDNQSFNQFEEFSLEVGQDLQSCWRFFSLVLQNAAQVFQVEGAANASSPVSSPTSSNNPALIMLSLIVKICQKDFEIWWKHHRRSEHKDNRELSFPILFYLLEARRGDIVENASKSVLNLYSIMLLKDVDMRDARKLVSMTAMLLAHLDSQDKNGFLTRAKGLKLRLANKIQLILAKSCLASDDLFIELSLLKPTWLSLLVSRRQLAQEKKIEVKGLEDVVGRLEHLATSCDIDLFACLDNLIPKMISTMQLHNIVRSCWHFQIAEENEENSQNQILAFPGLDKLEKVAHRSLTALKMKSDVTISKAQLIQDANILIDYHSRASESTGLVGVLRSAFFRMTSPTKF